MEERTVTIPNINCGHCAMSIKSEIGGIAGVESVDVDVSTRKATIRWSAPADWDSITAVLDEIGFPPGD